MKKIILSLSILYLLTGNLFSAGSSSSDDNAKTKSNYEKAVTHVEAAKKHEKKGKLEKANKRYAKAQGLLIKSNNKKPNNADTLNYLGFTTRKLGDFENGEKYYLQGLAIEPNHVGINEYLGELYVQTNQIDKANERLTVLKNCNCDEYDELQLIIKNNTKVV